MYARLLLYRAVSLTSVEIVTNSINASTQPRSCSARTWNNSPLVREAVRDVIERGEECEGPRLEVGQRFVEPADSMNGSRAA